VLSRRLESPLTNLEDQEDSLTLTLRSLKQLNKLSKDPEKKSMVETSELTSPTREEKVAVAAEEASEEVTEAVIEVTEVKEEEATVVVSVEAEEASEVMVKEVSVEASEEAEEETNFVLLIHNENYR